MTLRFSPLAFMAAYCLAYAAALFFDAPLFRYYPLHNLLNWGAGTVKGHGPAMAWYGLMADAALAALAAAFIVPNRWIDRALRNLFAIFPVAAMAVCVVLMWKFFA